MVKPIAQEKQKEAEEYLNTGNQLESEGYLEEAIACYRKSIELNPDLLGSYRHIRELLRKEGYLDDEINNGQNSDRGHDRLSLRGLDILVLSPTPTYPTDQGNRKRIYAVCQELRHRGARIHFVHYAQEWWGHIPEASIREMYQQWDSFHLISPTRPLHTPAENDDHTIDEWWDYSVGDYLKWLFSRNYFDVFLVNYTYLSKAFEFAPKHTYCILDTHDKFTDRRHLLESQGINREFFYTTKDQEAIALERADLVWAIKEEEAVFFSEIATTPVYTMPHIETPYKIKRSLTPADRDYLVLGMIGARNNVNLRNARTFIEKVLPKFRQYLAPIKIKFAGGMCSELKEFENLAGVELMGRVKDVEEFYQAIDIVIVPLTFSTGLKIKAVEALATGLPLIAHKHALEGIPTSHPCHQCESLEEIAEYCLDIAFNRNLLPELADATRLSYQNMLCQAQQAMDRTATKMLKGRPAIIIVLNEEFFADWSPIREQAIQTIHYLKYLGNLIYYVDTPLNSKRAALFEYHDAVGKVVLSENAAMASGLLDKRGQEHRHVSLGISYSISTLEELCSRRNILCLWLLDVPQELDRSELSPALSKTSAYVRTDVLRNCYQNSAKFETLMQTLAKFKNLTLINSTISALYQERHFSPQAQMLVVPYWRELPWQIKNKVPGKQVLILVSQQFLPIAYTLWNICANILQGESYPLVFLADEDKEADQKQYTFLENNRFAAETVPVSKLMSDFEVLGRWPRFVIDLSGEHLAFSAYRETLKRAAIPVITPDGGSNSRWHGFIRGTNPLKPVSTFQLVEIITKLITDEDYLIDVRQATHKQAASEYANDSGWARIWKEISMHKQMSHLLVELSPAA
jgi:glycosyltransferase involved in cell wall biosynthesis